MHLIKNDGWNTTTFLNIFEEPKKRLLSTLLTIVIVATFITLSNVFYALHKNISHIVKQHHSSLRIIIHLQKKIDNGLLLKILKEFKKNDNVKKINCFFHKEEFCKRHSSSQFNILNIIKEHQFSKVVIIVTLKTDFQDNKFINRLRNRILHIRGVRIIRIINRNNWFFILSAINKLISYVTLTVNILTVAIVFFVISNSMYINILSYHNGINIKNFITPINNFALRQFLYIGGLFGFFGSFLSLILSEILIFQLSPRVTRILKIFEKKTNFIGLSFDECILLLLIYSAVGLVTAWFITTRYFVILTSNKK